jgi:hypothetical protein
MVMPSASFCSSHSGGTPDQRAGAQEGGLVALAFLLGKGHHLDVERQPRAGAVQFLHAGHRHEDAQPAVVFAAIAHGVVVAAGQQRAARRARRPVAPDDIADGVDADLVEAAVLHLLLDQRGAGAVGVGQVGDGELALLGVTRVAVAGQDSCQSQTGCPCSGATPNLSFRRSSTMRWMLRRHSCSSKSGGCAAGARRWPGSLLGQPGAARSAHGQDEREAEARA